MQPEASRKVCKTVPQGAAETTNAPTVPSAEGAVFVQDSGRGELPKTRTSKTRSDAGPRDPRHEQRQPRPAPARQRNSASTLP